MGIKALKLTGFPPGECMAAVGFGVAEGIVFNLLAVIAYKLVTPAGGGIGIYFTLSSELHLNCSAYMK